MIGHVETWEPMVGDPIEGWRSWRAHQDSNGDWNLHSVYHDVIWTPSEPLEARCMSHDAHLLPTHGTPAPPGFQVKRVPAWPTMAGQTFGHECGIYAAKTRDLAAGFGLHLPADGCVIGTVKLWGRVCVHQKGWRGQFAYPAVIREVRAPDGLDEHELAAVLADRYGIDSEVVCP